jgi:hypothetical protein
MRRGADDASHLIASTTRSNASTPSDSGNGKETRLMLGTLVQVAAAKLRRRRESVRARPSALEDHRVLWSGAWGVLALAGFSLGGLFWQAAVSSTSQTPPPIWPAYVSWGVGVVALYFVFAPLLHTPPFRSRGEVASATPPDRSALAKHLEHMQTWAESHRTQITSNRMVNPEDGTPPSEAFPFHFPNEHRALVAYAEAVRGREAANDVLQKRAMAESDRLHRGQLAHFGREVFARAALLCLDGRVPVARDMVHIENIVGPGEGGWVVLGRTTGSNLRLSRNFQSEREARAYAAPISLALDGITEYPELESAKQAANAIREPGDLARRALDAVKYRVQIDPVSGCPTCPH